MTPRTVFSTLWSCCIELAAVTVIFTGAADAGPPSFRHDVMAVLSKAGCNAGTCHGNANGKGGFKLSLRGQDPEIDYRTLTRDLAGRRINRLDPLRSLILLKPTMQVPHEGGRRFVAGSPEHRILRDWVAAGMPRDEPGAPRLARLHVEPQQAVLVAPQRKVRLRAVAEFSDGGRRDVSRMAVYEPADEGLVEISPDGLVRGSKPGETTVVVRYLDRQAPVRLAFVPARPGFEFQAPQPANYIDQHVFAKLKTLRINPSEVCDDTVFVRRAYLDLLGLIPTAEEARRFVQSADADKRAKLIDELLQRPGFADFWALKWSDLLRNEEKTLDRKGVANYHAWIRRSISSGKPLNKFARELLAARGSTYKHPPANYYRAMRDPLTRAESTAQLFLGVRLQCARCHNHPFDRWTQDDYYGWANLFARVKYKIIENRRRDRNDKHEFDGEQVVYMAREGEVADPRSGKPAGVRFLGDEVESVDPTGDRLLQLAEWISRENNKRFARTQVNRIWYHLTGRGIVEPIDDFRATNPPVNPPLLEALADDFVNSGFELRHMIRRIMNSRTYQLSAEPNATNAGDETNFSRGIVRRLTAEQLLDSLARATGAAVEFNGYPLGTRAVQIPGVRAVRLRDEPAGAGDEFLKLFGKPPRLETCECERTNEPTLAQTFQLISGPLMNELLTREDNRLGTLLDSERTDAEIVEELYWTALSRPPTDPERTAGVRLLSETNDKCRALEDLAWALLNSSEFLLRR